MRTTVTIRNRNEDLVSLLVPDLVLSYPGAAWSTLPCWRRHC